MGKKGKNEWNKGLIDIFGPIVKDLLDTLNHERQLQVEKLKIELNDLKKHMPAVCNFQNMIDNLNNKKSLFVKRDAFYKAIINELKLSIKESTNTSPGFIQQKEMELDSALKSCEVNSKYLVQVNAELKSATENIILQIESSSQVIEQLNKYMLQLTDQDHKREEFSKELSDHNGKEYSNISDSVYAHEQQLQEIKQSISEIKKNYQENLKLLNGLLPRDQQVNIEKYGYLRTNSLFSSENRINKEKMDLDENLMQPN